MNVDINTYPLNSPEIQIPLYPPFLKGGEGGL